MDTHIALWAIADSERLPEDIKRILMDGENAVYYSLASVWEIAIKHSLHPEKMTISEAEFVTLCQEAGFVELTINAGHIYAISSLQKAETAPKHNDPFDRLLLAQAKAEEMQFFTHDSLIPYYNESCIYRV